MDDRTRAVLADLENWTGKACVACGKTLCGHAVLFSIVSGYKTSPRCYLCLAEHMGSNSASLRDRVRDFLMMKECYTAGWNHANRTEGFGDSREPGCIWPGEED
jgi:hypothetical protein